jgi:hypothetical protein
MSDDYACSRVTFRPPAAALRAGESETGFVQVLISWLDLHLCLRGQSICVGSACVYLMVLCVYEETQVTW